MIWSQEIRNDKPLYLTTHKSGWPPVSRHPAQEPAALSIWSLPSVSGLDSRLVLLCDRVLSRTGWTNKETMSPLARGVSKTVGCRPDTHTGSNGKSAWATTRNV